MGYHPQLQDLGQELGFPLCEHWTQLSLHIVNVDRFASCYARWWQASGDSGGDRWAVLGDARIAPDLVLALHYAGSSLVKSPSAQRMLPAAVMRHGNSLGRWLSALHLRGDAVTELQPRFNGCGLGQSRVIWDVADRSAQLCLELALTDPQDGGCNLGSWDDLLRFNGHTGKFEVIARESDRWLKC